MGKRILPAASGRALAGCRFCPQLAPAPPTLARLRAAPCSHPRSLQFREQEKREVAGDGEQRGEKERERCTNTATVDVSQHSHMQKMKCLNSDLNRWRTIGADDKVSAWFLVAAFLLACSLHCFRGCRMVRLPP